MIPKETKLQGVLKMEHKPQQIFNFSKCLEDGIKENTHTKVFSPITLKKLANIFACCYALQPWNMELIHSSKDNIGLLKWLEQLIG
jgi:hypothetical protein